MRKKIRFTQHAIKRAFERKLVKYLNKDTFYYGAYLDSARVKVDDVIYAFVEDETEIRITTMYKDLPMTNIIN